LADIFNTNFGELHAVMMFEAKRFGHNANSENAHVPRQTRNHGRSTRACAAAHSGCNKHHVRALQSGFNLGFGFFGSFRTKFRPRASAKTLSCFWAKLDMGRSFRSRERLGVSVRRDKFHTLQLAFNHIVDGITACATNTKNDYSGSEIYRHYIRLKLYTLQKGPET
jgi:hypothetical protein